MVRSIAFLAALALCLLPSAPAQAQVDPLEGDPVFRAMSDELARSAEKRPCLPRPEFGK